MTRSTHYPSYQLFLQHLRAARKAQGVNQESMAQKLGNHQVFISKLERGERRMDVIDLYEYCEAAGIDFVAFVKQLGDALADMPGDSRHGKLSVRTPKRKRAGRSRKT